MNNRFFRQPVAKWCDRDSGFRSNPPGSSQPRCRSIAPPREGSPPRLTASAMKVWRVAGLGISGLELLRRRQVKRQRYSVRNKFLYGWRWGHAFYDLTVLVSRSISRACKESECSRSFNRASDVATVSFGVQSSLTGFLASGLLFSRSTTQRSEPTSMTSVRPITFIFSPFAGSDLSVTTFILPVSS